jgi:ATP-dependent Clp protease protease subunit
MSNLIMPEGRYVLPSFEERTSYGFKNTNPYTKLFEERVVFVGAPIDDTVADDVMAQLLVLEAQDADRDILMYINSPGGSFTALTAIYDTMKFIRPHVQTICLGQASSAAAILLAAGQKGKRMALPNARIMIHQPSMNGERGQASDIEIQAAEALRIRSWLETTLHADTGRSVELIHNDIERDKYLTAEEALEYGIIDTILTSRKR